MIKKLRQKKGETLIEALVSMLIALLSMGILSSAVLVAANINKENRQRDAEYAEKLYQAEGMVEQMEEPEAQAYIQFHEDLAGNSAYIDIILYGGEDNDFVSYEEKERSVEP